MQAVFLSSLGSRGLRFRGTQDLDQLGVVSSAGDVNGDGIDDFILGGPRNGGINAYLLYGRADGQFGSLSLDALAAGDGFRIQSASGTASSNVALASAGDFNGDGYDDIVLGGVNSDGTSGAWLVFGGPTGRSSVNLATLTAGQGFFIQGGANDSTGFSVSSAGDINHDGFDDIIVGSPDDGTGGSLAGQAHVIFGKASGFGTIDLASLPAGAGFVIRGNATQEFVGYDVSSAGDVNGDGIDDLVVSAPFADEGGTHDSGAVYLIYGKTSPFGSINLATLGGSDGAIIRGVERIGWSVAGAGDVNGDGYEDIIVGAPQNNGFHGRTYVVFGKAGGIGNIDVTTMTAAQGFRLDGGSFDQQAGYTVAAAGDVDGDGFDDLLLSAPFNGAGTSWLILGKSDITGFNLDDMNVADPAQGFRIFGESGNDSSGRTLSSAGDVNDDGVADILVGSRDNNGAGFARGASYLIFGLLPTAAVVRSGTAAGQNLTGGNFDDQLYGLGGADILYGNGGVDLLDGGEGNDYLYGGLGADSMFGGAGDDTARVSAADTALDLVEMGTGVDHLIADYAAAASAVVLDNPSYGQNGAQTVIRVGGAARVQANNIERLTITTGTGDDIVYGVSNDDLISTQGGNDTIYSGPVVGRDRIDGGAGTDLAINVNWSDLGEGQGVNFDVNQAAGVTIGAGASERYLRGIEQLELFFTGAGNDVITLSTNAALRNGIDTGLGDDVVTVFGGATGATTAAGSAVEMYFGNDHLIVDYRAAIEAVTFAALPEEDLGTRAQVRIGGVITLGFRHVEKLTMTTGSGNDSVYGTAGDDLLSTGAGTDSLTGGAGNDTLNGGSGSDTMAGGLGDDSYFVDSVGDVVVEAFNQGYDIIYSAVSYALTAEMFVEVLATIDNTATTPLNLTGNALANYLVGNAGANLLDGGAGPDQLWGRGGADSYYADAGDDVVEYDGDGYDILYARSSYALGIGQSIEVLATIDNTATTAINLTGNAFDSYIVGNAGANTLDGGGGSDQLWGREGDDSYIADMNDIVLEYAGQGNDILYATASYILAAGLSIETLATADNTATTAINLTGNELDNYVTGNAGANTLDGGTGSDMLWGRGGDDSYFVDGNDVVREDAGQGNDIIYARGSFGLGAGVSVEILATVDNTATTALNLTGNELDNYIVGNAGANTLNGGTGSDTLWGREGDDSYFADGNDLVLEYAGQGNDIVYARNSFTLAAGVSIEELRAADENTTTALDLTGNELDQRIYGNAGANVLNGGLGYDEMFGGFGADTYLFNSALGTGNVDTIDFSRADGDRIVLDHNIFTALGVGALASSAFAESPEQITADTRIYHGGLGLYYYDADGSGEGEAVLFLSSLVMTPLGALDFTVI